MNLLPEPVDLTQVAAALIADLPLHDAGRTATSVLHGDELRAVVMALGAGRELADHRAPGPATIQVLSGDLEFRAGEESVHLSSGDLLPIPPVAHSVHARTDAAFLLTICLP